MQTPDFSRLVAAEPNVSNPERWLSVVGGAAIATYGLTRRSGPGLALAAIGGMLLWRGATGSCPLYKSFGISTATDEGQGDQVSVPYGRGVRVEQAVTINATPEQLYSFWRNFENLPRFMDNLESVKTTGLNRWHWVAKGPVGMDAEWEAEIINEVPNELIGWRSIEGSKVDNAGSVHFTPAPGGRGTEVRVILRYDPPGGKLGALVSKVFGEDPERQVREDLRRLKQIIETGEIPTTSGQPAGRK